MKIHHCCSRWSGLSLTRSTFGAIVCACTAWAGSAVAQPTAMPADRPTVIVVVGAAGEAEYANDFSRQALRWKEAAARAGADCVAIGIDDVEQRTDQERLKAILEALPKQGSAELWLVLIGHGTFDGKEARFNLRGPDVTATDLAAWLQPVERPIAVIDTASASAPFLQKLSKAGRVVVTATRSGYEVNFARFGQYLSGAIASTEGDLDKDGQTSLLEAFLTASSRVGEFYKAEGRLATEHALIDDNGDGLGTPADWFRGIRATRKARDGASLDGLRAHQFHLVRSDSEQKLPPSIRARRNELELAIAKLRETKAEIPESEYYRKLEVLLLELAQLYEQASSS